MIDGNRAASAFHRNKRQMLQQVLVTGDCLEHMDDDLRVSVYRRDQWVAKRTTSGDLLHIGLLQEIDAATLTEEQRAALPLEPEKYSDADPSKRMVEMYTFQRWQHDTRKWLVQQEIKDTIFHEFDDAVAHYWTTPYDLVAGEQYGRGFAELLLLGQLRGLNSLESRLLDWAGMASKMVPVTDYSSLVRPADLSKRTGEPIKARVQGGEVQDVAFLSVNKVADFQVVTASVDRMETNLGKVMATESEVTPRGDRVTREQVMRVGAEIDAATGGVFSEIADDNQVPTLRRATDVLERHYGLKSLPEGSTSTQVLTGLAALAAQNRLNKALQFVGVAGQLGEQAIARINPGKAMEIAASTTGVAEPGLIYTEAEIEQQRAAAMQAALTEQAGSQAIESAGAIAEAGATS